MPTYRVGYQTGAYTFVTVEADSPEEARELADETFEAPFVCGQCSGWGSEYDKTNSGIELGDDWEQDETAGGVVSA